MGSVNNCRTCNFCRIFDGEYYCLVKRERITRIDHAEIDIECASYVKEAAKPIVYSRVEQDLDSIEVSSSPRRKIKIYINSRSDQPQEVEDRIKQMGKYCISAEEALKETEVKNG